MRGRKLVLRAILNRSGTDGGNSATILNYETEAEIARETEDNGVIDIFWFCICSLLGAALVFMMKKVFPEVKLENLVTDYMYTEGCKNHQTSPQKSYDNNDITGEGKNQGESYQHRIDLDHISAIQSHITKAQHQAWKQNEIKKLKGLLQRRVTARDR